MTRNLEKLVTFASPTMMRPNMETITLSYEPGSDFAKALDELIRNSEGVRVVRRKSETTRKKRCALDEAIQEEKEGKLHTYESVDDFFKAMGIECGK